MSALEKGLLIVPLDRLKEEFGYDYSQHVWNHFPLVLIVDCLLRLELDVVMYGDIDLLKMTPKEYVEHLQGELVTRQAIYPELPEELFRPFAQQIIAGLANILRTLAIPALKAKKALLPSVSFVNDSRIEISFYYKPETL